MPSKTITLIGGSEQQTGYGQWTRLAVSGTWVAGDTWSAVMAFAGSSITIGAGRLIGIAPSFCLTFNDRVYVTAGTQMLGSSIGDPTGWEIQDALSLVVDASDRVANVEPLISLASYQGRLATFARHTIIIWIVDANPNNFAVSQVLNNIGTIAPLSVQGLGDLDVLFLADTGVRSLRVRDSSLNAFVADLGSAIDLILQAKMATLTDQQIAAACGIVEPTSNRYWLFLGDTLYVFSYFPASKVLAWSTYVPSYETNVTAGKSFSAGVINQALTIGQTYWFDMGNATSISTTGAGGSITMTSSGFFVADKTTCVIAGPSSASYTGHLYTQVPFVIEKMVIYHGLIYVRDTLGNVYQYGGPTGNTYDHALASVLTPFFDGKKPGTRKQGTNVDVSMQGTWLVEAAMDYKTVPTPFKLICRELAPTFDPQSFPYSAEGTHFQIRARCADASYAALSALLFHYNEGIERR